MKKKFDWKKRLTECNIKYNTNFKNLRKFNKWKKKYEKNQSLLKYKEWIQDGKYIAQYRNFIRKENIEETSNLFLKKNSKLLTKTIISDTLLNKSNFLKTKSVNFSIFFNKRIIQWHYWKRKKLWIFKKNIKILKKKKSIKFLRNSNIDFLIKKQFRLCAFSISSNEFFNAAKFIRTVPFIFTNSVARFIKYFF